MAKSTGRVPEGLNGPPFPDRFVHIWEAFLDLHGGRTYGPEGRPNPLTWADVDAWDRLTRAGLQEWEVRAIKALDLLWLRVAHEDT